MAAKAAEILYADCMDKHDVNYLLDSIHGMAEEENGAHVYYVNPWDDEECPFVHYVVSNQPMNAEELRLFYESDQDRSARESLKKGESSYEVLTWFDLSQQEVEKLARELNINLSPTWVHDAEAEIRAASVKAIQEKAAAEIKAIQEGASS